MVFSLIGFLIALSIFLPNLTFVIFPPKRVPKVITSAGFIFTLLERIGQIGCISILVLTRGNYSTINIWFILMVICIAIYYLLWLRYIIKGQDLIWCFKPLSFIPIPMALFPVLAFLLAALWGMSLYLGIATIMLAIGHIANSYHTYKLLENKKR